MGSHANIDTVVSLLEEQAAKQPDKACIVKGNRSLTYSELVEQASGLAKVLKDRGLLPEQPVVILTKRSIEYVIGVCGILMAGGCYVPLDPAWPDGRVSFLLEDCKPFIILNPGTRGIEGNGISQLDLRDENNYIGRKSPMLSQTLPEQLAYIMYTSGTSGSPKGTLVEHKSIVRLVKQPNYVELNQDTALLQTASLAFDAATFELWGCLLNGGTIFLTDEEVLTDSELLKKELTGNGINTLWLTTALFHYLTDSDPSVFHGLNYLLTGGELISETHVRLFQKANPDVALINCYGPTENTTFTTFYRVPAEFEEIPIGTAVSSTQVFLLDGDRVCHPGETGEICITGLGLARGYLNLPDLTTELFCKNPFGEGRMYRSGDLARERSDGNLQFLGRIDEQVKIRGYRVEPEEVRQVLCRMQHIRDAVVTVKKNRLGENYLCACYIAEKMLTTDEIREYLKGELPTYMLPSFYAAIDKIPITANGKIDRISLAGILHTATDESCGTYDAKVPVSHTEKRLIAIFQEILEDIPIGKKDSFFECGGQSISAAIALTRIKEEFGHKLPLRDIYLNPSAEKLAVLLSQRSLSEDTACREMLPDTDASYTQVELQQILVRQEDTYRERLAFGTLLKTVPLSPIQEISMQSGIKVSGMEMDFYEDLDRKRLNKVWTRLRSEYDVLRCFFRINETERGMAVYETEGTADIPFLNLSGCEQAARYNLLAQLKDKRTRYYDNQSYLGDTAAHGIVLVKLEDRHYRLYFYCTHLIFDGYSADLLEGRIRELYAMQGNIDTTAEHVHAYEQYTGTVLTSSPGIPEAELIQQIGLNSFAGSLQAYKELTQREEMECFCYSYERKPDNKLPRHKLVTLVELAYDKALRCAFGDVKVPFFVIINGREYSAFQFYDEIGELIDCMPFVFDAGNPEPVFTSMAAQLVRMKCFNINYVGLMVSPDLQQKYPAIAQLLMSVGMSNVNIPIFNYLVMYEDIAPEHDENTPEMQDGTAMNVSSIGYAGNRVDLYLLCPKNRVAAVKQVLAEMLPE